MTAKNRASNWASAEGHKLTEQNETKYVIARDTAMQFTF